MIGGIVITHNQSADLWDISNQCERELIRISHIYESKHGISDTAFWILYTLHGNDDKMTQTDICNCLYAPRQSTNSALGKLEKDGIFVGNGVNTEALAAVNMAFPFVMVTNAFSVISYVSSFTVAVVNETSEGLQPLFRHLLLCHLI